MVHRRKRADLVLVERKIFSSREKAQEAIEGGRVFIDRKPVAKVSALVDADASIEVTEADEYVSRGAFKLEKAFEAFGLQAEDKVILDAGASTGGFTDYLLRHGARKAICIDVGYGQLAWSLRNDPRVELHERTNVRFLTASDISEPADMVVVDLSFISVSKVMDALVSALKPGGSIVVLVKPQFEVEAGQVGKGGIVREAALHSAAIHRVKTSAQAVGLTVSGLTYSPITGADGNIEYLMLLSDAQVKVEQGSGIRPDIAGVVQEAHANLGKKNMSRH